MIGVGECVGLLLILQLVRILSGKFRPMYQMIMKKLFILVLVFYSITMMANTQTKIVLSIGNESMTANLVDNEATRALVSLLKHAPITIDMSDYGGFEKVGELPQSLPTSNTQITTEPGDIMLYQGRSLVVFYGSNSWSYTRLGRIEEATVATLRQFLAAEMLN